MIAGILNFCYVRVSLKGDGTTGQTQVNN